MASRAKNKLPIFDTISQYRKQQQRYILQTNNKGQRAQNHQNTFYEKVRTITEELNIKLEEAVTQKES